jgi:hypothetical protein
MVTTTTSTIAHVSEPRTGDKVLGMMVHTLGLDIRVSSPTGSYMYVLFIIILYTF